MFITSPVIGMVVFVGFVRMSTTAPGATPTTSAPANTPGTTTTTTLPFTGQGSVAIRILTVTGAGPGFGVLGIGRRRGAQRR